jgi:protein TonB
MGRDRLSILSILVIACTAQLTPLLSQDDSGKQTQGPEPIYKVARGIAAPRVIRTVDPNCDAARKQGRPGTVTLTLVVTREGQAKDIKVLKSVSPAIDQEAIEVVSQWKFAPATKDGKPVAVKTAVQVSCHW